MTWREYHEATRHSVESLRRSRHFLDWANMPDPFRHYEGVPLLDLPADPQLPEAPALEILNGASDDTAAPDGPAWLSQLLFHSAAISASKVVPSSGNRYALRVNPSSGNLHPTEFHFRTKGLKNWPYGMYHYRPSAHMAEQRALGDFGRTLENNSAPVVFILTSIAWREAWKYTADAQPTTAAPTTAAPTTAPPCTTNCPAHVDNPYAGAKGYVNPEWKAKADAEPGGSRVSNTADRGLAGPDRRHRGHHRQQLQRRMGLRAHLDAALAPGRRLRPVRHLRPARPRLLGAGLQR